MADNNEFKKREDEALRKVKEKEVEEKKTRCDMCGADIQKGEKLCQECKDKITARLKMDRPADYHHRHSLRIIV
ncbi:hypothetical protein KAS41_03765 [Candidatus Parcubacteria bacterium]|nr:hypothetical protein [Candidatus Parcubacteria bacterium]